MAMGGVERNQELQDNSIYIDARSADQRLGDQLFKHDIFRNVVLGITAATIVFPVIIILSVPIVLIAYGWWTGRIRRFRMPIRFPAWTGHYDPSGIDDNQGAVKAQGIEFIGVERKGRTNDRTMEIWASDSDVRTHRVIFGTTGAGKAQPLDAKVLTPSGWVLMGDINPGDIVSVPDGGTAKVTSVYPQGKIDIYKITFADGRSTEACGNHLWEVHHKHWNEKYKEGKLRVGCTKPRVINTLDLANKLNTNKGVFSVPLIKPIEYTKKNLSIDPYLLGALLGDGSLLKNFRFSSADREIIDKVSTILDQYNMQLHQYDSDHKFDFWMQVKPEFLCVGRKKNGDYHRNPLKASLDEMGLLNKRSHQKFIPRIYFDASIEQRIELVRGLMDTDGCADKHGCISFTTTSEQLAYDVQSLIWSLGGIAKIIRKEINAFTYKGERKISKPSYTVRIRYSQPAELFALSRKKDRVHTYQYGEELKLRVVSIEPIGKKKAQCIFIDHPRHLYITDNYIATHNTETLLSILFNPLCWGSGFSMTDGKAQIDVTARIFVMSRMFWREDDVLILNYMRGGQDRFKEMVSKPKVGVRKTRVSNTWNPFSTANHETINQIIDSIMEKASGDGAQWQAKAINMKNALVQTIAYLRAKGDMLMSVGAIREQMSLDNMVKLAMRNDIPPAAAAAIRSYLSSGLPGFSWGKAKNGKPQDSDTLLQHGYLTGQFTRTLGLMTDTYFDIFGDEIPEFDTSDVILNNRISFTMIPTLEKGVEEAGNLGKMQVASAKMMMSENLGYELEGMFEDVVDNRQTNTRRPFYLVMDELGYYFAPGIDLMFAQGRSLQIALIAAGQDFQAMAKDNKNEVESMIANTRIKCSMKLEDPKETYEIFQKAGGRASVAKMSGFEMAEAGMGTPVGQYKRMKNASIEETDRISLQELKKLGPGDGVMLYSDKVIRYKSFNLFMRYKFDKKKVNIRINSFLPIAAPDFGQIMELSKPIANDKESLGSRVMSVLKGGNINWPSNADELEKADSIMSSLLSASEYISNNINLTPQDKGIILFMAAIEAMDEEVAVEASGQASGGNSVRPSTDPKDKGSPVLIGNELDFMNNPPIIERVVKHKDTTDPSDPEWGNDSVAMAAPKDDDLSFGDTPLEDKTKKELDFSDETRAELEKAMLNINGGSNAISSESIQSEIDKTKRLVNESCRYNAKPTNGSVPSVLSDVDDVLSALDDISRDLIM